MADVDDQAIYRMGWELAKSAQEMLNDADGATISNLVTLVGTAHAQVLAYSISRGADRVRVIEVAKKLIEGLVPAIDSTPRFDA